VHDKRVPKKHLDLEEEVTEGRKKCKIRRSVICGLHQIYQSEWETRQWNHVARMGEKKKAKKISTWNRVRKRQLRISTLQDNIQMDLNGKKYEK
jgi:hypothetical protein